MKITPHELKKLRSKGSMPIQYLTQLSPKDAEEYRKLLGAKVDLLAKLILRRHGVDPSKHRINMDNGEITERTN